MDAFSDRTKLELRKFADAFVALQQADEDDRGDRKSRDSLLLNYVFSFEMAWQSMRLVLADRGDTETPRLTFATLATAFKVGMIRDPALWKDMREARNDVVHAYDERKAIALAAFVRAKAIPELKRLLVALQAEGTGGG